MKPFNSSRRALVPSITATLVLAAASACSQAQMSAPSGAAPAAAPQQPAPERPPFKTQLWGLKAGDFAPEARIHTPDGKEVDVRDYMKGATVLFLWRKGPEGSNLEFIERLSREYGKQGLTVLGAATFSRREDFQDWLAANKGRYSFPVLFDPAGPMPDRPADMTQLTQAQLQKLQAEVAALLKGSVLGQLAYVGEPLPPGRNYAIPGLPAAIVFDADRKLVGVTSVGAALDLKSDPVSMAGDAEGREGLGNLLLLVGVKPRPEDAPKRVFTAGMVTHYDQWMKEEQSRERTSGRPTLPIGAMAPDFTMIDAAGKTVKLSDYRGKVVILDYWATWCGPCLASMPHMQALAEKYRDQGVVVLGSATKDERAAFEKWVGKNQPQYPDIVYAHDPAERASGRASNAQYGVKGLPTQFVIDREGRIVGRTLGIPRRGSSVSPTAVQEYYMSKAGVNVSGEVLKEGEQAAADSEETFRKMEGGAANIRHGS